MNTRRRTLVAAAALAILPCAHAQAPAPAATRSYAVISLVADQMGVVIYQPQVGSSIDQNRREAFPIGAANIDESALVAAHEALKRAEPAATVHLLKVSEASLYDAQRSMLDGTRFVPPDDVAQALAQTKATHLLLFTKWRGDARLQAERQRLGSGKLEGIGYFIDPSLRMIRTDTGEVGTGYLAPYVYARLSLIDLGRAAVVAQETVQETTTLSAARAKDGVSPWNALSNAEKISTLRRMVAESMGKAITAVLAPRGAGG